MGNCGERIKKAREAANLTQEELGEKVGVTGVTIMRYEKGQRQPRLEQLVDIAAALGVGAIDLMDLAPEERHQVELEQVNMEEIDRVFTALEKAVAAQEREFSSVASREIERQIVSIVHDELNTSGKIETLKFVRGLSYLSDYQRPLFDTKKTPPQPE